MLESVDKRLARLKKQEALLRAIEVEIERRADSDNPCGRDDHLVYVGMQIAVERTWLSLYGGQLSPEVLAAKLAGLDRREPKLNATTYEDLTLRCLDDCEGEGEEDE